MLSRPLKYNPQKFQTLYSILLTINEAGCFLRKCEAELTGPAFSDPHDERLKDRLRYFSCLFWLQATMKRSGVLGVWARLQLEDTCVEDEVIRLSFAKNYQQVLDLLLSFNDSLPASQSLSARLAELSAWVKGDYFSIFAAAYQSLEKYIRDAWKWRCAGYLFVDFLNVGSNPAYQQELFGYEQQGLKLLNIRQLMVTAMQPLENCRFLRKLFSNQLIQAACEEARQELNLNALGKKFCSFLTAWPDAQEATDFFKWRQEEQAQKARAATEALSLKLRKKLEKFISCIFDNRFTEIVLQAYLDEEFYSEAMTLWGLEAIKILKMKVAEVISKRASLKLAYPEGSKETFPGVDFPARFMTARECAKEYFLSALRERKADEPQSKTIEEFLAKAWQEHLDEHYFLRARRILAKVKNLSAQLLSENTQDQQELAADLSLLGDNEDTKIKYWAGVLLLIAIHEKEKLKQEETAQLVFFPKARLKKESFLSLQTILNLKSAAYSLSELIDEYDCALSLELNENEKWGLLALIKKLKSLSQPIYDAYISVSIAMAPSVG